MQAIILAGGFGTRLRQVVKDVPKPMADINGKPFLHYLIQNLKDSGIKKIIISTGYLKEKISEYFSDNYLDLEIAYATEDKPLGTGGAIKNSLRFCDQNSDILVLNGDSFLQFNLEDFIKNHKGQKMSMVLRKMDDCSRYGRVIFDENNIVTNFEEKSAEKKSGFINGGIYLLKCNLFAEFDLPEVFSFESDFLAKKLDKLKPKALLSDGYFIDIGIPDDYKKAREELVKII